MADLTQDIAGPVPLDLLRAWADGAQDVGSAMELLSAFRIEGTVVASDTSGLSQLCESRDIVDVLAMISAPKAVLHAVGVEIGGRPIGTWVADNTEMYYPATVPAESVLAATAEAQWRLATSSMAGLGVCIHHGIFYEIGGGLYGRDADTVESLAEHHAHGGETLVTESIANGLLGSVDFAFQLREDLPAAGCRVFTLVARRRMPELKADNRAYPHPYPQEFFDLLGALGEGEQAVRVKEEIHARYLQERAVVFLSVARDEAQVPSELLDGLVTNALLDTVIRSTAGSLDHIAASSGGLGILTFMAASEALDFAMTVRARCMQNALPVKIGIDQGSLLLFAHPGGGITGDPVNIASKISEDAGATGRINITSRAASQLPNLADGLPYHVTVSGRELNGIFM